MDKKISLFLIILFSSFLLSSCSSNHSFTQAQSREKTPTQPLNTAEATVMTNDPIWKADAQTIWNKLQHTPLSQLETAQASDSYVGGWIKLAIISKRYSTNTPELVPQLIDWRQQYPNHPGNQLFPDNTSLTNLLNHQPPKKIAVLLPLEGQYGSSGKAVREGFLGGYYMALTKNQSASNISFYDTSTSDVNTLYHKAVNEGAEVVIGPLLKEHVQTISSQGSLPVPTIALNYTTQWMGSLPNNLYQFGLSPNDEALQTAEKARQAGLSHALLIVPQTEWGKNVVKSLTEEWQSLGGTIVDSYYFAPNANFGQDIPRLLHISPEQNQDKTITSSERQELQKKQLRQDFDVIFLLAPPVTAREIVPLLHFYYVQNTPIYSTSVIYAGSPSPQRDTDLNGVNFCDTPWTLKMAGNKMQSNRLYAVGRDAYLISQDLDRMAQLPNFPIYGTTGALTLTSQHQIYRRLAWAQFHDGRP